MNKFRFRKSVSVLVLLALIFVTVLSSMGCSENENESTVLDSLENVGDIEIDINPSDYADWPYAYEIFSSIQDGDIKTAICSFINEFDNLEDEQQLLGYFYLATGDELEIRRMFLYSDQELAGELERQLEHGDAQKKDPSKQYYLALLYKYGDFATEDDRWIGNRKCGEILEDMKKEYANDRIAPLIMLTLLWHHQTNTGSGNPNEDWEKAKQIAIEILEKYPNTCIATYAQINYGSILWMQYSINNRLDNMDEAYIKIQGATSMPDCTLVGGKSLHALAEETISELKEREESMRPSL